MASKEKGSLSLILLTEWPSGIDFVSQNGPATRVLSFQRNRLIKSLIFIRIFWVAGLSDAQLSSIIQLNDVLFAR